MADAYSTYEHDELLCYTSADDAIRDRVDASIPELLPKTITAYAWVRRKVTDEIESRLAEAIAEHAHEHLDLIEELGDPDGGPKPPEWLTEAAKVFAAECRKRYRVWAHDRVPSEDVTVVTEDWLSKQVFQANNGKCLAQSPAENSLRCHECSRAGGGTMKPITREEYVAAYGNGDGWELYSAESLDDDSWSTAWVRGGVCIEHRHVRGLTSYWTWTEGAEREAEG